MKKHSISTIVHRSIFIITSLAVTASCGLGLIAKRNLESAALLEASERARALIEANVPQITSDLLLTNPSTIPLRLILLRANFAHSQLEMKVWDKENKVIFESDLFRDSAPNATYTQSGEHSYSKGWVTSTRPLRNGLNKIGFVAFSVAIQNESAAAFRSFVIHSLATILCSFGVLVFILNRLLKRRLVEPIRRLVDDLPKLSKCTDLESADMEAESFDEIDRLRGQLLDSYVKIHKQSLAAQFLASQLAEKNVKVSVAQQVAHDIRSPLSALNMALRKLSSHDDAATDLMQNAITRINMIANDLLHDARKANTKSEFECFNVTTALNRIAREKALEFQTDTQVRFEFNFSNSIAMVRGSEQEFARIISNLVNNAVESLEGSSGVIRIASFEDGEMLVIKVADSGRGIPASVLSRLGERGFSYGKSSNNSGSGLGLSSAKDFVYSRNGRFDIESTVAVGTTVTIRLPYMGWSELRMAGQTLTEPRP